MRIHGHQKGAMPIQSNLFRIRNSFLNNNTDVFLNSEIKKKFFYRSFIKTHKNTHKKGTQHTDTQHNTQA